MISLESLKRRVQMMLSMMRVVKVDESAHLQKLEFIQLNGEKRKKREHFLPYGFAQWPWKKTGEGIALSITGDREHLIVINVADRQHRLKLKEEGEVALYDDQGQYILLKRKGIEITTPLSLEINALSVDIKSPVVKINGVPII